MSELYDANTASKRRLTLGLTFAHSHRPIARFLRRLGAGFRLILFDRRGTGLSDRVPDDALPTLEGLMDDARAVLDAAGSEQAAVFAQGYGTPLATVFAATYPERIRALILYSPVA